MNDAPSRARDVKDSTDDVNEKRWMLVEKILIRRPADTHEFRREQMKRFVADIREHLRVGDESCRHQNEYSPEKESRCFRGRRRRGDSHLPRRRRDAKKLEEPLSQLQQL